MYFDFHCQPNLADIIMGPLKGTAWGLEALPLWAGSINATSKYFRLSE